VDTFIAGNPDLASYDDEKGRSDGRAGLTAKKNEKKYTLIIQSSHGEYPYIHLICMDERWE
jgi:hypothetical protein